MIVYYGSLGDKIVYVDEELKSCVIESDIGWRIFDIFGCKLDSFTDYFRLNPLPGRVSEDKYFLMGDLAFMASTPISSVEFVALIPHGNFSYLRCVVELARIIRFTVWFACSSDLKQFKGAYCDMPQIKAVTGEGIAKLVMSGYLK